MAKVTLTTTVRVEVDTEKWRTEYALGTQDDAVADAQHYLPELIKAGLSRQLDWGIVTAVAVREEEEEGPGEDSAAPAPGTFTITPQGQAKIDAHLARRRASTE